MEKMIIAAIMILIVVCVFTFFMVYYLASNVRQKLKKEVFRYIKIFNESIESKPVNNEDGGETLVATTINRDNEIKQNSTLAIPYMIKPEAMQDDHILEDYKKIRSTFLYDVDEALKRVETNGEEAKNQQAYKRILEILSFDNVYKISLLQPEDQFDLVEEILGEEEKAILQEYIEMIRDEFDIAQFAFYIKNRWKEYDTTIFLHFGTNTMQFKNDHNQQVIVVKDENICEGFQIYQGNLLYDYGLSSSDFA